MTMSQTMLCFKGKQSEEETNGNDSYVSACSTTYSYAEYSIDEGTMNNGPSTHTWSASSLIPGTIEAITSTRVSSLSRDEFDCVTKKNKDYQKKLANQTTICLKNTTPCTNNAFCNNK